MSGATTAGVTDTVPALRFPEFEGEWEEKRLGAYFDEFKEKSAEQDQFEVLTSARTGLVRQKDYYDNDRITDRDNIGFNIIPPNYLTYRSRSDDRRFFFNENHLGITGIISVYYPVFRIVEGDNIFFTELLARHSNHIGKFSVGTSQTVLSMNELKRIKLPIPEADEQKKIAAFLGVVDAKIAALRERVAGLERYKRGLMQALFSQTLRFTKPDGTAFPDWEEKRLVEVLHEHKAKSSGNEEVFSVSVHKGLVNQIEHLGRSFSAANTDHYNRVKPNDIVYTKSPTGDFPLGIIKQSHVKKDVIVSPLYGVFTPETPALGLILHVHFESNVNVSNYLSPIVQKGAKNTINVTNSGFLSNKLTLPVDPDEQARIAEALQAMDAKITAVTAQLDRMQDFKKGLLQQMFV